MTKAELEKYRDEWKQQAESLQEYLDALNDAYSELECELAYYKDSLLFNGINDLDNFIFRMKIEGVWTESLQEFIDNYMRWYNEGSD